MAALHRHRSARSSLPRKGLCCVVVDGLSQGGCRVPLSGVASSLVSAMGLVGARVRVVGVLVAPTRSPRSEA
eukprot:850485-Rhodomonas_salina.1